MCLELVGDPEFAGLCTELFFAEEAMYNKLWDLPASVCSFHLYSEKNNSFL